MDQTSQSEKAHQKQVYEDILNNLYKAGYYRVQINTLSEFDKVVGGLCWSILSSGDNVDVDILFRENLNIGQKITLSEAIVKALRKMKCPHPLQAHQIQGGQANLSDFPAIHPVIIWLIKKSIAFKEKRNTQMRAYATQQFKKNYILPKDSTEGDILSSKELNKLIQKQKVTRKFKGAVLTDNSQDARILSCLIEYGESFNLKKGSGVTSGGTKGGAKSDSKSSQFTFIDESVDDGEDKIFRITVDDSLADLTTDPQTVAASPTKAGNPDVDLNEFDKKLAKVVKETEEEDAKFQELLVNAESNMRSQMTEIQSGSAGSGVPISGSQVGAIVSQNASEISSAAAQYTEQTKQMKKLFETQTGSAGSGNISGTRNSTETGTGTGAPQSKYLSLMKQKEIFTTQMTELNQKIKTLKEKVTAPEHAALQGKYESAVQERQTAVEYLEKLNAKYRLLQELEAKYSPQQKHIDELSRLIELRDQLKKEEDDFRAGCKAQMLQLKEKIHLYETADPDQIAQDANEEARMKEIEDAFEKVWGKHQEMRKRIAEVNIEVASSSRAIDDVPTRWELIQYERRFAELSQQIAWKLDEQKKYIAVYNSLANKQAFLNREVKLLNSISENLKDASKSTSSRTEFLTQLGTIVKGVEENLKQQESTVNLRSSQVEVLKSVYQQLVEQQRDYFKAIKDFQEECDKNEWLTSRLEMIAQSSG